MLYHLVVPSFVSCLCLEFVAGMVFFCSGFVLYQTNSFGGDKAFDDVAIIVVAGLEAAQLLVALDLSHNLIPNVTALAPLRLNPRLQYLDISHNDIGGHPVDSSRYSFPSLLNNQEPCFSKEEERELQEEVKGGGAQWEIQAVFGGLKLRLLQISGNVAAGDKSFVRALVKALPSLELLDGEQVQ